VTYSVDRGRIELPASALRTRRYPSLAIDPNGAADRVLTCISSLGGQFSNVHFREERYSRYSQHTPSPLKDPGSNYSSSGCRWNRTINSCASSRCDTFSPCAQTKLVRQARIELATFHVSGGNSTKLSYCRKKKCGCLITLDTMSRHWFHGSAVLPCPFAPTP
jgi:hypothetical protein